VRRTANPIVPPATISGKFDVWFKAV
jgi:hypothetical protein